jgi:hypothetical protein
MADLTVDGLEWIEGLIQSTPMESWRNPLHWINPLESSREATLVGCHGHRSNPRPGARIIFALLLLE